MVYFFEGLKEMETYTSTLSLLIDSPVRIMLLYPILSLSPVSGLVLIQQIQQKHLAQTSMLCIPLREDTHKKVFF